ncbi:unnamed protein product, partial [Closterium sp. NIES-54]
DHRSSLDSHLHPSPPLNPFSPPPVHSLPHAPPAASARPWTRRCPSGRGPRTSTPTRTPRPLIPTPPPPSLPPPPPPSHRLAPHSTSRRRR